MEKFGEFHADDRIPRPPDAREAWYIMDRAPSLLQFRRITAAIFDIYKLQQAPCDLVETPLDVIPYLLTFRTADKKDKTLANSVRNTVLCGQALLARARSTLKERFLSSAQTAADSSAAPPSTPAEPPATIPFSDPEVDAAIGQVFQRARERPSLTALDEGARRHSLNRDATKALASSTIHHVTIVHGPPGTGKAIFSAATMDTWADALPDGQT
eukprot:1615763-Pyramimonas_sp.AAC.1